MLITAHDMCNVYFAAREANWLTGKHFIDREGLTTTRERYFATMDGHDWIGHWQQQGASKDLAQRIVREFDAIYATFEPCELVPGAREVLREIGPVTFVTNAQGNVPYLRIQRHNLTDFVGRILQPGGHKGEALAELSQGHPIVFTGDAEGDGLAVAYLRSAGIPAAFIAVTHEYGINPPRIKTYAQKNPDFCVVAQAITHIPAILKALRKEAERKNPFSDLSVLQG